ncbi:MAG: hypothetical protein ACRC1D_01475 [Culicoidibacterales bacterium]
MENTIKMETLLDELSIAESNLAECEPQTVTEHLYLGIVFGLNVQIDALFKSMRLENIA